MYFFAPRIRKYGVISTIPAAESTLYKKYIQIWRAREHPPLSRDINPEAPRRIERYYSRSNVRNAAILGIAFVHSHFAGGMSLVMLRQHLCVRRISMTVLYRQLTFCFALTAVLIVNVSARAQTDPASLAAHDAHQGLLVSVNPYLSAEQSKAKFAKHTPYEGGVLALEVYFKNDNDTPIRLNLTTIRLVFAGPADSRQRLEPLSPEDVADLTLLKQRKDPSQQRPRLPFPGRTGRPNRDKEWDQFAGALRSAAMPTEVLAPHSITHGFFYFDVDHHFDLLSNARFEVPDLSFLGDKKPLFFFEIDLAPAIH
jgi:hypothetical protein